MRRIIAAMLVLLMMVFAGCGGKSSTPVADNNANTGDTGGNTDPGNDTGNNNGGNQEDGNPLPVTVTVTDVAEVIGATLSEIAGDASGLIVAGTSGGKLVMVKFTPLGTLVPGWPKEINGSSIFAIDSNSSMSAMLYAIPSSSVLMMDLYDSAATGLMTAFNISDNSQAGDFKADGSALYLCRFGGIESNAIFYSTLDTLVPVEVNPTFKPQKLHVMNNGVVVVGENTLAKYAKGLSGELWKTTWADEQNVRVDSVTSDGSRIFIGGSDGSGNLRLAGIISAGNETNWSRSFPTVNTVNSKVYLGADSNGEVYISIAGNMAKVNTVNGNLPSSAAQVPEGPFKIIGNQAYFLQGSKVKAVSLTQIP